MQEPLSTEPYKGVRDFYPGEFAQRQAVFDVIRRTLKLYGFEAYDASPMERSELYESKGNQEIIDEQTYTFTDRGDRRVTLRPEMTPTLARMVAGKRRELVFPLRWYSIGNRFRYERPQKGRLREFYQVDVDIIGIKDAKAEGEAITIAHAVLTALGAKNEDFIIRVSSRKVLDAACNAAGMNGEAKRAYLRLLDRKAKITPAEFSAALGAIGSTDPLEVVEKRTDPETNAECEKLEALIKALNERGITNAIFDPTIVRGFEYYTGTVFEIFDTNPENPRALFGGGRYDELLSLFGGDPIPAMGFAFGDVTLMQFLETHGLLPAAHSAPQLFLGTPSEGDIAAAQKVATELRALGVSVLVNVMDKSLGDQIREADKRGVPFFAAIGSAEAESGTLKVKRLATGEEQLLDASAAAAYIRS